MICLDLETVAIDGAEGLMEPVQPPSNYKNQEAIDKYVAEKTKERLERASLYPYTARIVALGVQDERASDPTVWIAENEAQETSLLRKFWAEAYQPVSGYVEPLVTFNGLKFDLPLLMVRSRLLGVSCPELNLDRYRTPHVDLMERLTFRGALDARSLKWFAKRLGISVTDPTTGADIAQAVATKDWGLIAAHCISDVRLTHQVAMKLGVFGRQTTAA